MSFTKENLQKRQSQLQIEIWKLCAEIRVKEKQLEQLGNLYEANEQILKDFATEEAIEKAKDLKPDREAQKKA